MDKKRILILIGFTIFVIVLGYLLYIFFFAPPKEAPVIPGEEVIPGDEAFPTAGEGVRPIGIGVTPTVLPTSPAVPTEPGLPQEEARLSRIVDNSIKNPQLSSQGTINFYDSQDGKFYRRNKSGGVEELSDKVFFNVDNVTWSPTREEAVIEYPDGANIYYNFETKRQTTLPKHWEEFSFSSDGGNIAAKSIGLSPENRWIVTSNPDGSEITTIEPLGRNADKVDINWSPSGEVVGFSRTGEPMGADRQEVLLVGLNGENFPSTVVEGRGFESSWSPTGKKLLYSVYSARSDFKPELWIVNAQGDTIGTGRKPLSLNTWAEKCSFKDERFVYCAVPQTMDQGTGFAPQLSDTTPDNIFRVDTQTGLRTQISLDENHTVESMFLSDDGNTLYFTDKRQNGLFELVL